MKISNYKNIVSVAWILMGIMILLIGFSVLLIKNLVLNILLVLLGIGLFFILINLRIIEYESTDYFIRIRKNYLLRKSKGREKLIEIPVHQLMDYSVKEKYLSYQVILIIVYRDKRKKIKINCMGFTWKLMIRMIKSLKNVSESNH